MKTHFKPSLPFLGALLAPLLVGASRPAQAAPAVVREVTPQSLKSEIAKNKGKVVVVNFWATWCAPCVAELPALAQFAQKTAPKGAVLLLVSGDDSSARAQAARVAGQKGHRVTRLIKGDMVEFFNKFDPKFKGAVALPRTYIYNRKGQQVKALESDHTLAQYQKLVAPYL